LRQIPLWVGREVAEKTLALAAALWPKQSNLDEGPARSDVSGSPIKKA